MVVLLYSKLSKFKDLENRQNQLVNEMDNAIGVYLMEMKEENDRLISELKNTSSPLKVAQVTEQPQFVSAKQVLKEVAEEVAAPKQVESSTTTDKPELEPRKYVPVKLAANAYSKQKAANVEETEQVEAELFKKTIEPSSKEQTYEQQVIEHYHNGKSIEEIAKLMQRGKTEIELLVKFRA